LSSRTFAGCARPFDAILVTNHGDQKGRVLRTDALLDDIIQLRHEILPYQPFSPAFAR
jgi:hypothetical protein